MNGPFGMNLQNPEAQVLFMYSEPQSGCHLDAWRQGNETESLQPVFSMSVCFNKVWALNLGLYMFLPSLGVA